MRSPHVHYSNNIVNPTSHSTFLKSKSATGNSNPGTSFTSNQDLLEVLAHALDPQAPGELRILGDIILVLARHTKSSTETPRDDELPILLAVSVAIERAR